ncbi:MAG: hypothetical protein F6K24_07350 [Okeania sp. SIO2D1]|nr:hypothetical protein [Okeania sp. SIO2D1]
MKKEEEGRRKKEEGRRKKEEGRRKKEEGRRKNEKMDGDSQGTTAPRLINPTNYKKIQLQIIF